MNERGFSGNHRSSLARPTGFLSFSTSIFVRSPLCGLIPVTFQFAVAPPGPLQFGRLRSPENGSLLLPLLPFSARKVSGYHFNYSWVLGWVPNNKQHSLGSTEQQAWFNCKPTHSRSQAYKEMQCQN